MRIKDTSTVYSYSISVCMGSFVFGYELTSFSNLTHLISNTNQWDNQLQLSQTLLVLSLLLPISAIAGVIIYRFLIKTFGWIRTFNITDYLTIIAAIIGILSLTPSTQITSRLLYGIVTGINTILIPTYLTSVLPGAMGGPAGTLNQLFITIGIFFGYWVGYLVIGEESSLLGWRFIIGLPIIPALIRLHTSQNVFPYESLESLIENEEDDILQHYLDLIYEQVTIEQFKQAKRLPDIDIQSQKASFYDPVSQPHNRRLILTSVIVFLNQLSGGAALGNFGSNVSFLSLSGSSQGVLTIFVFLNLLQVGVTLFSGQLLQKYGRRAFMLEGQRIIIISLLLIAFIEIFVPRLHFFTVILTFIQMIGFSVCYGPCTFLIGTEVLHDIYYPSLLLWLFIFINTVAVGTFVNALGIGPLCLFYCIVQIFGFLYISGYQVETQGRSRRDVYADFRRGSFPNPVRYLQKKLGQTEQPKEKYDIQIPLVERSY